MAKRNYTHTFERINSLLSYDPETGKFYWIKSGKEAGTITYEGYAQLCIDSVRYKAHRVAWLLTYGKWPEDQIDHINGVKNDNRICNLRECSNRENQQNVGLRKDNKTGYIGVHYCNKSKKYRAQIKHKGKMILLGMFDEIEKAAREYELAKSYFHSFSPKVRKA